MTSCGYAVPTVNQEAHGRHKLEASSREIEKTGKLTDPPCRCFEDRHLLERWLVNKVNKKALEEYIGTCNSRSLDGLPGLRVARKWKGEWLWMDFRFWIAKKLGYPEAILLGVFIGIFLALLAPVLREALLFTLEQLKGPLSGLLVAVLGWMRMLSYKLSLIWRILSLHMHSVREQTG